MCALDLFKHPKRNRAIANLLDLDVLLDEQEIASTWKSGAPPRPLAWAQSLVVWATAADAALQSKELWGLQKYPLLHQLDALLRAFKPAQPLTHPSAEPASQPSNPDLLIATGAQPVALLDCLPPLT
ncbi:hypothetical protein NDU88_006080 [Pleurodeles waltl]|uniref:Uncharacterized protein n=1 Tax=Pleurodeles waltl TaxID=8319 RepID=A0AAV7WZQ7_PLEWA|nr:hypothetical protein NDU88_006080 [Pleurodeles waltl]